MPEPVLPTKLHIPASPASLLPRPRLLERLDEGLRPGCRLLLVSAPAGYGKTTLVAQWAQERRKDGGGRSAKPGLAMKSESEHASDLHARGTLRSPSSLILPPFRFAWLSLDENDSDPARFSAGLVAALRAAGQTVGSHPQGDSLPALIGDLAAIPNQVVLILDDYHLVKALPIHEQLVSLVEYLPPQVRLVIISREDPPLPLSRLRARGHLVEIRQSDLRFTAEEAGDFLQRVAQVALSAADMAALHERTEGWAAGLQLAALSLRGRDDVARLVESFSGSQHYVLDYLLDEVVRRQPPEVQEFLLQTSILDWFNAPLCDAVLDRANSREELERLERNNLFVVPLDESRQWYRYHRLFAGLLRHRLQLLEGLDLPELHRRASRWYAAHGFAAEAVCHALAACDWQAASALLLSGMSGGLPRRSEMISMLGWFEDLPDEMARASPWLCCEYSWPLQRTGQVEAAEVYLRQLEQAAQGPAGSAGLMGQVMAAQAHLAQEHGDTDQATQLSERALALLPDDHRRLRTVLALNAGMARWLQGRLAAAAGLLAEAQQVSRESANPYAWVAASAFLNKTRLAAGKLREAAAGCDEIVRQGGALPMVCLAWFDLAEIHREWNDLGGALSYVRRGLELSLSSGSAELQAVGYGTLALIEQSRGDCPAARGALQRAGELSRQAGVSPGSFLSTQAVHILVAAAEGDLEAAAQAAQPMPAADGGGSVPDYLWLLLAHGRLFIVQGSPAQAHKHLKALEDRALRAGWMSIAMRALALRALAVSDPDEALALLGETLAWAEPEGHVRLFVDLGEPMARLLAQAAARGLYPGYATRLLAAFGKEEGRRMKDEAQSAPLHPSTFLLHPLAEPLSDRELEVLRLLATGQTYEQMAQALCISRNTVKTHLKSIYGKLGVTSRQEAIGRAAALGLVPLAHS